MKIQISLFSVLAFSTLTVTLAAAQYAERPDLAGSGSPAVDVSGRSVKNPRVRAIHSDSLSDVGGTAWLLENDPYLAYQLGRNLNFREFRERDGIFSPLVSPLKGPMPDGTTAKITANNQVSCSGCHNLPYGNAGGGTNFSKDSGLARNAPHYYGGGLVEMLAIQIRRDLLRGIDGNGDGWVSAAEAQAAPGDLSIKSTPAGGAGVSYGNPQLSGGSTGQPDLNNIFRVWYVDDQGRHVEGATEVDGVTTFGYNFNMIVWGWGQGKGRAALNPTNRAFLWDPYLTHGGLDSHDPSTNVDVDGDGVSEPTVCGSIQFPATHKAPDKGLTMDPLGFSTDDPDGDGHLTEISEGDLDLAEWFMLNAPRPAFAGDKVEYQAGLTAMKALDCTSCHVPNWRIKSQSPLHTGDRRFFDLDVTWNDDAGRLEGEVVPLFTKSGDAYVREFKKYEVEAFFSDLKHHEMGETFAEVDFGGNVNTLWRTPPLWGVGSGFPWGHDGASLSLRDVIERHGGEAQASKNLWDSNPQLQDDILGFLERLVLYDVESLPTDMDGDGVISEDFVVAGMNTGLERFNPEWLFRVPVQIQGDFVNTEGVTVRSFAAVNLFDAYGLGLPFRVDTDLDGWPDVWDNAPNDPGYKDGVN